MFLGSYAFSIFQMHLQYLPVLLHLWSCSFLEGFRGFIGWVESNVSVDQVLACFHGCSTLFVCSVRCLPICFISGNPGCQNGKLAVGGITQATIQTDVPLRNGNETKENRLAVALLSQKPVFQLGIFP